MRATARGTETAAEQPSAERTQALPSQEAPDAGSVSEADGFEKLDVPDWLEHPEPLAPEDPGCPNRLGWGGNCYSDDPQYGVYGDLLDAPPEITAKKGIFVAVVGDAGAEVRLPRPERLHGCAVSSVVFSEADVLGHGAVLGPQVLREEASDAEVKYILLAPDAVSYCRRRGLGPGDEVKRSYDKDVKRAMALWVSQLPDWKVLAVVPRISSWLDDFSPAERRRTTWSSWSETWGTTEARVQARHWNKTGDRPTFGGDAPSSSGPPTASWSTAVRHIVAGLLNDDVDSTSGLAARVADAVANVDLSTAGRVARHAVRGPPLWDPRAAKLAEDVACPAGMRDPADLVKSWPRLWEAMAPVGAVLLRARAADDRIQKLTDCLGTAPAKPPPDEATILDLRRLVGLELGVPGDAVDLHSAFSPWRYELVAAVQRQSADPDVALPSWLRDGAPMGIQRPIDPGNGIFPSAVSPRALAPEAVTARPQQRNHASFRDRRGQAQSPGHLVVQSHLSSGYAYLFENKAAAERHFGTRIAAAPLGCVSKQKESGEWKHRVIQDLKANGVNAACVTPERQVLPTVFQHARDVALLGALAEACGTGAAVESLVLDIRDAFMGIPLHPSEQPYNACGTDDVLYRGREPLYAGEPASGHFVVWAVLGFGGKPNPLVFARCVAFAARTGQALLRPSEGSPGAAAAGYARLQLYVDDPVVTTAGTDVQRATAVDLLLLWWLVLGLPLAWPKGLWARQAHRWIGADFRYQAAAAAPQTGSWTDSGCIVTVPEAFAQNLYLMLAPLAQETGHVGEADLAEILGKCGRLAYILPACKPFVASLWGALAGSKAAAASRRRPEAPHGRHAARRFAVAARWLRTLLRPPASSGAVPLLPLENLVVISMRPITLEGPVVRLDASPWGGGAVLFLNGVVAEHASCSWSPATARRFQVALGSSRGQTTWEYMVIWLALETWGDRFRHEGLAILGDNIAALCGALSLKGKAGLSRITRELAWRKVRRGWRYACGHLPAEHNDLADALSRLTAPTGNAKAFPACLETSAPRQFPDPEDLWVCS